MKATERTYALRKEMRPDPDQPRKHFDPVKLQELADSLKANGVIEDLRVRPDVSGKAKFLIVEGERRYRAAELAGIDRLPIQVRELTDEEARREQFISGTQRENLNALEQAAACDREIKVRQGKDGKFTAEDYAKELGLSRATIYNRLKLTRLHEPVRQALLDGKIEVSVAAEISKVPDPSVQQEIVGRLGNERERNWPFSFRKVQELIASEYMADLKDVPFDKASSSLVKGVCACNECPKRSGNLTKLFPDIKNPNVCTDVACFQKKREAHNKAVIEQQNTKGCKVLSDKEAKEIFNDYGAADLSYYAPFVELSTRCEVNGEYVGNNHWKGTLKDKCPPVVLAVDPNGRLRELVDKNKAVKALKATGWKPRSYSSGGMSSADRTAQKKRQKKENKYRAAAALATAHILEKLVVKHSGTGVSIDVRAWKLIAQAAYHSQDIGRHDFVAKRRGLAETVNEARPKTEKWLKTVTDPVELARLAVECLICAHWSGGGWHQVDWNKDFQAVCKLAKVDLAKLLSVVEKQKAEKKTKGGKK